MEGVGWIMAIIIGAIAGWIAEKVMHVEHGLLTNIILGILGAIIFNAIIGFIFGAGLSGWLGSLIAGAIGACILIAAYRAFKGRA